MVATTTLDGSTRRLDPRQRTVWAVGGSTPPLVVGVVLVGAGVATATGAAVAVGAAVALAGGALGALWGAAVWGRWSWSAWPDALELRHGVVVARASLVPYQRIQQIDVARGPLERALGLSRLVLRTASATSDAELPGIPAEQADELRRHLLARAGLDDAV